MANIPIPIYKQHKRLRKELHATFFNKIWYFFPIFLLRILGGLDYSFNLTGEYAVLRLLLLVLWSAVLHIVLQYTYEAVNADSDDKISFMQTIQNIKTRVFWRKVIWSCVIFMLAIICYLIIVSILVMIHPVLALIMTLLIVYYVQSFMLVFPLMDRKPTITFFQACKQSRTLIKGKRRNFLKLCIPFIVFHVAISMVVVRFIGQLDDLYYIELNRVSALFILIFIAVFFLQIYMICLTFKWQGSIMKEFGDLTE